jgi:hypothetical protein
MWGQKHRDDAHVLYVDESKSKVVEIAFRIDANAISPELVKLGQPEMQKRFNYPMKDKDNPPRKDD